MNLVDTQAEGEVEVGILDIVVVAVADPYVVVVVEMYCIDTISEVGVGEEG